MLRLAYRNEGINGKETPTSASYNNPNVEYDKAKHAETKKYTIFIIFFTKATKNHPS